MTFTVSRLQKVVGVSRNFATS